MPFLQSVEEAHLVYEQSKENEQDTIEEKIGIDLDAEKEQEVADAEEEGEEEHPEYLHIDPDQVQDQPDGEVGVKRVFKTITIPTKDVQLEEARKLDKWQKYVLSLGVQYAKRLVIFRNYKSKMKKPLPPLVIVHGGAGSGKSKVIHSLSVMMQDLLCQEGDDPGCPYVVLSSFTGAAAANVNGQTLHSLFGFKFGAKFVSMSDKQQDEKRNQFRNLKCLIIDEISMVSCELFYNLNLKLREIMMVDEIMGGISVFVFGDLFQLKPIKGGYIFEKN